MCPAVGRLPNTAGILPLLSSFRGSQFSVTITTKDNAQVNFGIDAFQACSIRYKNICTLPSCVVEVSTGVGSIP
jgi:hypothetical protein